jgi:hypothetical protein
LIFTSCLLTVQIFNLSAFKIVDFNIKAMGATEQSKEGRNSKASLKSLIRKVKSYRETLSSLILKTAFFFNYIIISPLLCG